MREIERSKVEGRRSGRVLMCRLRRMGEVMNCGAGVSACQCLYARCSPHPRQAGRRCIPPSSHSSQVSIARSVTQGEGGMMSRKDQWDGRRSAPGTVARISSRPFILDPIGCMIVASLWTCSEYNPASFSLLLSIGLMNDNACAWLNTLMR